MRTFLIFVFLACLTLMSAILSTYLLEAQALGFGASDLPDEDPGNFSPNTSDFIANEIANARRHIAEAARTESETERRRMYRLAVESLQQVLDDRDLTEHVVPVKGSDRQWIGALEACEQMIRELPLEGREVYEERYQDRAAVELDLALHTNDEARYRSILHRFALTPGGQRAARLYAQKAFEQGHFADAAYALRRAMDTTGDTDPERHAATVASLAASLGFCLHRLGAQQPLEELISSTKEHGSLLITLGGEKRPLREYLAGLSSTVKDGLTEKAVLQDLALPIYSLSNTALPDTPETIAGAAWKKTLPTPGASPYPTHRFMNIPPPEMPPIMPIVHGTLVLANSGSTLSAFDLYTGTAPWPGVTPYKDGPTSYHLLEQDSNLILTVAAWKHLAFAALENPLDRVTQPVEADSRFGFPLYPDFPMVHRALTAVDLTSGRINWVLGGGYDNGRPGDDMEAFAASISFHHSVVIDETLYAIGGTREGQAELFLFAINPESGKPLWFISLCQGQQENTMFGKAAREPIPGIPIYAYGTLYLCTNLGGVVAVDLAARSVSWISRYEAMPRPYTRDMTCYYRNVTFANGAPAIVRDTKDRLLLIVAPTDSRMLSALDTESGAIMWKVPVEGMQRSINDHGDEGPTVFIGASGTHAYVGCGELLLQVDIASGAMSGKASVPWTSGGKTVTNALAGRPLLASHEILWPGARGTVGIAHGSTPLGARITTSRTNQCNGGNLLVNDDILICSSGVYYLQRGASAPTIEVRFDLPSLLSSLRTDLEKHPESAEAHLRYGQLAARLIGREEITEEDVEHLLREALRLSTDDPMGENTRLIATQCLFQMLFDRAVVAFEAQQRELFISSLTDAEIFVLNDGQRLDVFRLRESALVEWKQRNELRDLYTRHIEEGTFDVLSSYGKLSVQSYARIMLAKMALDDGRHTAALEYLQAVIEGMAGDAQQNKTYERLVKWIDEVTGTHGETAYAVIERRARNILENHDSGDSPDSRQLLEIAYMYPNSNAGMDALACFCQQQEKGDIYEGKAASAVSWLLSQRKENQHVAQAWLALYNMHQRRDQIVAMRVIRSRLKRFEPALRVMWRDHECTLETILEELGKAADIRSSAGVQGPQLVLPVAEIPAWQTTSVANASQISLPHQPAGEGELVYMLRSEGGFQGIVACEAADGTERWQAPFPRGKDVFLYVKGDAVIATGANVVSAFSRINGEQLWSVPLLGFALWHENADGFLIFLVSSPERENPDAMDLVALDCETGNISWRTTLECGSSTLRSLHDAFLYVAGDPSTGPKLFCVELASGKITAAASLGARFLGRTIGVTSAGSVMVALSDSTLAVFQEDSLKPVTTFRHSIKGLHSIHVYEDTVVLASQNDGAFVAYSASSGKQLWEMKGCHPGFILAPSAIAQQGMRLDAVMSNTSSAMPEIRLVSLDMIKGTLRYSTRIADSTKDKRTFFASVAYFNSGTAILLRRREVHTEETSEGVITIQQWSGFVSVVDQSSGEVISSYMTPEARSAISESSLEVHEEGLAINSDGTLYFLPEAAQD